MLPGKADHASFRSNSARSHNITARFARLRCMRRSFRILIASFVLGEVISWYSRDPLQRDIVHVVKDHDGEYKRPMILFHCFLHEQ